MPKISFRHMPSCVAQGCSARSLIGDKFKVFPRKDVKRRQIWIERVNRPGWSPSRYSALCERHFDLEQWEVPRQDGKWKLKDTAVPTIFCVEHPSADDVTAKDHAYCILGYRQLYPSGSNYGNYSSAPFEHVKIEVDESEIFAPELICEELIAEGSDDDAENIQCTLDISVYPKLNELEPIEMVQCEVNETNTSLNEPSLDPLAITAEDLKHAPSVVPHFSHGQRFVFVPKNEKIVVVSSASTQVTGEPTSATGIRTKPKLRVLSQQQLLKLPQVIASLRNQLPEHAKPKDISISNPKGLPNKKCLACIKRVHKSSKLKSNSQLTNLCKSSLPTLIRKKIISPIQNSVHLKNSKVTGLQRVLLPKPPTLMPSPEFGGIFYYLLK